ncbi:uncharacterized protein PITG_10928 [Phytophthora infestans T30-4]|uniref:DDE Tnp4 domain-containing protein n=1 Tax=Phytophthora infestans (strain T30-4) TaxID=403677 RepID=D0NFR9_PHYIT|nr:uncharacterized protein PITG_10928 [Phytophthora infestans T30-4]EEY57120.1 conserved hypothetical protein [Phytophthora infestans T30-4]|eukprot:XP_002901730.1 conserved hypothetical protein [Phytophthora infestans T30-4]
MAAAVAAVSAATGALATSWFLVNLRCGQATFLRLCEALRRELRDFELDRFVKEHTFEEKAACLLFFLGSLGGYRETTAAFAVSKKSLPKFAAFEAKGGIPGVVGAFDGSLVEINRPDDFEGYYCRKMHPALIVQAVANDKMQFMSADIRPGSWSDQKTWRASALSSRIDSYLPTGTHFLGDAGECLTRKQLRYSYLHSRSRMAVECSFGLWKGRFRIVNCCLNTKSVEEPWIFFLRDAGSRKRDSILAITEVFASY